MTMSVQHRQLRATFCRCVIMSFASNLRRATALARRMFGVGHGTCWYRDDVEIEELLYTVCPPPTPWGAWRGPPARPVGDAGVRRPPRGGRLRGGAPDKFSRKIRFKASRQTDHSLRRTSTVLSGRVFAVLRPPVAYVDARPPPRHTCG